MLTPAKIADTEAHALWRRAIEIQAAAEQGASPARRLPAAAAAGLSLDDVVEIARGAGVAPSYVYLALAERALPEAESFDRDRRAARWARTLVRTGDVLETSQLIDAPPERVAAAFAAVVAKPAFELQLEDRVGPNPPYDGVLVYRIGQRAWRGSPFHDGMYLADLRIMLVTLRAEGDGTRLHLRLPYFAHGTNLSLTGILAGGLGAAGGYGGAIAGTALAAVLGTAALPLIAAPAAVGVLAGGALGVAGFRGVVRWGRRKGETELRRLLKVVALEAGTHPL
jgi:hypothetical protein